MAKIQIVEICNTINTEHIFRSCSIRCNKYEIDPASIVEDTGRERFRPRTAAGRTAGRETSIPSFQLP